MEKDYEKAFKVVVPLLKAIAKWEKANGTSAAVLPHEYEEFMVEYKDAMLRSSPRLALSMVGIEI